MQISDLHKMTVIGNIQQMAAIVGLQVKSVDELLSTSYDELHEIQNSLIPLYNEKINNQSTI